MIATALLIEKRVRDATPEPGQVDGDGTQPADLTPVDMEAQQFEGSAAMSLYFFVFNLVVCLCGTHFIWSDRDSQSILDRCLWIIFKSSSYHQIMFTGRPPCLIAFVMPTYSPMNPRLWLALGEYG